MNRTVLVISIVVAAALLASGCASPNDAVPLTEPGQASARVELAGFWNGLWDGMTAVFAFFGDLLGLGEWNVYEVRNNGNWYNFGFLIGIGALLGGSSRAGR